MILETEYFIDMDNIDISEYIGDEYDIFKNSIPELQYNIIASGLKLLVATNESQTEVLDLVADTLLNENMELHAKKMEILNVLLNALTSVLEDSGITFDNDELELTFECIEILVNILNVFYEVNDMDKDILDLSDKLQDLQVHPVDRFIFVYSAVSGEEDTSLVESIIQDVSEVTLNIILSAVNDDDAQVDVIPEPIVNRIKLNKELLSDTVGWNHILNGGGIGSEFNSVQSFYASELSTFSEDDSVEGVINYLKNLISLMLISDLSNEVIKEKIDEMTQELAEDILTMMEVETFLSNIQLEENNEVEDEEG